MGVQAQFGAIGADRTLRPHHEGLAATAAKLIFTLAAREMHATYENSTSLFSVSFVKKYIYIRDLHMG